MMVGRPVELHAVLEQPDQGDPQRQVELGDVAHREHPARDEQMRGQSRQEQQGGDDRGRLAPVRRRGARIVQRSAVAHRL